MNFSPVIASMQGGLPQLCGRSLWTYRGLWVLLAAAALAALTATVLDGTMQPLVLGIRLMKSAVLVAVAAILFWKRPRDPVAAILALAFLCWTITSSVDFTSTQMWPMLLDRIRFLLFVMALLLFPDGSWRPLWARKLALLSIVVFGLGVAEVAGLLPTNAYLLPAIACVLAAILSLIMRFRRTSSETQQQQLKWVLFGLGTGIGLILSARASAALTGASIAFEALFQLGIVLVALGFLVPLLRYRLYDAEAVISRSIGYAVLTAVLVATFAGSEALIELLGQQYFGSWVGQVSGAMAAAVAAVLLTPLNERISGWMEQRFQHDLVQLRTDLPNLLLEIPHSWSLRQIGEAALAHITQAIHATSAAIVIEGNAVAAESVDLRHVRRSMRDFPLQLSLCPRFGELRGALLIGPRPDGSRFGRDEVEAVQAVVAPLSRALQLSVEHELKRQDADDSQSALNRRLDEMSVRLEALERSS